MALTPLDNYNALIAPALGGAVALAAKCIGQEIIGRIHMIGIFLMETYTHFARALGCWGHQLLFWATLKFAPCFVPLGLWDISSSI